MTLRRNIGIALIMFVMIATLFASLALAFSGTSATYSLGKSTSGESGGTGTSSTYSLRFTQTASQAGNNNGTSSTFSVNIGWFNLSDGTVTLAVTGVECSNDSSNYYSCSQMDYDTNITHIRVNCTGNNVTTVSFNMYNTPDTNYYLNESNYTSSSGNSYILNSSYKLQDSGQWNLTVTCYDSDGNTTQNNSNWTLPWGWVNVSLTSPSSDANVTKDEFFTFTSTVTCVAGECGTANITLDPYRVVGNETVYYEDEDSETGSGPSSDSEKIIKEINVVLQYSGGSVFDEDNDGTETTTGMIDYTVKNTEFSWNVDPTKLCSKWRTRSIDNATDMIVCYGNPTCCNLLGFNALEPTWNNVFYSHLGRYGATYNNVVAAQVVYADNPFDLDNTPDEIVYSDWAELSALFEETDATDADVAEVFDEGESIEVDGKTVGEKTEDEPDYETHFVSMEDSADEFTVIFYHDAPTSLPVRTEGDIKRTLSTRIAQPFENVTLTVQKVDGILPRFELHLGAESEVFEFGKVIPEVEAEDALVSIVDRYDDKLDVDIVKGVERIEIAGVEEEPEIVADMVEADSPIIKTNAAYVENLTNFETARVTLQADELITAIYHCTDFDALTEECAAWEQTDIAFVQDEGVIRFNVDHFSAYAGGTTNDTAYLVVWDETDPSMPNASQSKALNAQVLFFADYKISANGTKITDGSCSINFDGGSYTAMTYNSTYAYYMYNRTFSTNGVYTFNVNCSHSTYSDLNATDTISVPTTAKNGAVSTTTGATPFYTNSSNPQVCNIPRAGDSCTKTWYVNSTGVLDTSHVFFVIANMTNNTAYVADNQSSNITLTIVANDTTNPTLTSINVTPTIVNTAQQVTIYATATDNVQVDTCWANITLPNTSVVQVTDVCTAAGTYTTAIVGVHNVTFYANDTSGNSATASSTTFTVDTTDPNLNSTSASVTSSGATISFSANESVNASVNYGTNSSLGTTATTTTFAASGTVSVSSLSASTLYYYNITVCDQAGNCLTNGTFNFTTSAASSGSTGGGGGGGSTATCTPDWQCTSWSVCSEEGTRTRSCVDASGCGDDSSKPSESGSCNYVLPPGSVVRGGDAGDSGAGGEAAPEQVQEPEAATATQPVASSAAEEPQEEKEPDKITGAAVAEKEKEGRVMLETGWWFLLLIVIVVLIITGILEYLHYKKKHQQQ